MAAPRQLLEHTDFEPFRRLSGQPWAMTAHVVYETIDPDWPASLSPQVIEDVIRGWIGFDGFLVSDDVTMKALKGDVGALSLAAVEAGCDAILHCNGDSHEMERVARATPRLSEAALRRLARGNAMLPQRPEELNVAAALGRIETLLAA